MNSMKKLSYLSLLAGISFCLVFSASISGARGMKEKDIHQNTIKKQLESAIEASPENYAIHYYLGIVYLREGDRDEAINAWETYLGSAPEDSRSVSIRERLTVLKMEQARAFARKAAKLALGGETTAEVRDDTIAVLDFKNLGTAELMPFIKGLTAMIITDLSKVPQLKVVERARMKALMDEMKLAQTGIIDASTTARMGRLLQARTIDWGELKALANDIISIRTVLSDTLSQAKIGERTTEGPRKRFFELQKQLVFDILALLGIKTEELDEDVLKALRTVHTQNYDAFISYGKGIDFLDKGDFSQAKESFETATQLDPGFDLADTAERSTPAAEIVVTTFTVEPQTEETTGEIAEDKDTTTADRDDGTTTSDEGEDTQTIAASEATVTESIVTEPTPVEITTNITQDTTVVVTATDSGGVDTGTDSGPTHQYGYFTNILSNTDGAYHGIYYTAWKQDLNDWTADSSWGHPSTASGVLETINSLVVVDTVDSITIGMPNDTTWTEMGHNAYMVWGHWNDTDEMVRQSNPTAPLGHYVFDSIGYFIYGDYTNEEQWASLASGDISLTYSGNAYGTHAAAPSEMMTGTFTALIDILGGSADVRDFDLSVSGGDHSATIENGVGSMFHGELDLWNATVTVDNDPTTDFFWVSGSLYGPAGENIGGIFAIEKDSGANSVNGIFEGSR